MSEKEREKIWPMKRHEDEWADQRARQKCYVKQGEAHKHLHLTGSNKI